MGLGALVAEGAAAMGFVVPASGVAVGAGLGALEAEGATGVSAGAPDPVGVPGAAGAGAAWVAGATGWVPGAGAAVVGVGGEEDATSPVPAAEPGAGSPSRAVGRSGASASVPEA